jgi:hypothetical protein
MVIIVLQKMLRLFLYTWRQRPSRGSMFRNVPISRTMHNTRNHRLKKVSRTGYADTGPVLQSTHTVVPSFVFIRKLLHYLRLLIRGLRDQSKCCKLWVSRRRTRTSRTAQVQLSVALLNCVSFALNEVASRPERGLTRTYRWISPPHVT